MRPFGAPPFDDPRCGDPRCGDPRFDDPPSAPLAGRSRGPVRIGGQVRTDGGPRTAP